MISKGIIEVEKQGKMWYNITLEKAEVEGKDMVDLWSLNETERSFRNLHPRTNGSPSAGTPPKGSVYLHHEFSGLSKIYTERSYHGGYNCRLNAVLFSTEGGEFLTTREVATTMKVAYSRLYQLLADLETSGRVKVKRFNRAIVWDDELLKAVESEAVRRGWIDEPILTAVKEKTGQK